MKNSAITRASVYVISMAWIVNVILQRSNLVLYAVSFQNVPHPSPPHVTLLNDERFKNEISVINCAINFKYRIQHIKTRRYTVSRLTESLQNQLKSSQNEQQNQSQFENTAFEFAQLKEFRSKLPASKWPKSQGKKTVSLFLFWKDIAMFLFKQHTAHCSVC
jgi:hypothetical protein